MTTSVIIQARMNSTRLPGKVMLELGGETVLSHVIKRCLAIKNADSVCCAIPDGTECNQIADEAVRCGALVFRGSESDVLDRYHKAAISVKCDRVLRITSDCPLIDPTVCEAVIDLLDDEDCDFATNNLPPSWPHGLDCEAFSADLLAKAASLANSPHQREHVGPWMRDENPDVHIKNYPAPISDLSRYRWTLDTSKDYAFFKALFQFMPKDTQSYSYELPLEIVRANPSLSAINAIS